MKFGKWHIAPLFAWYDFWVGWFWNIEKRKLYIFPIPMFGVMVWKEMPTNRSLDIQRLDRMVADEREADA